MTVILGTVASENAKSSFAPFVMIAFHSWSVPGRKPGTSSNTSRGILKQSQNLTKRAPFTLECMSNNQRSALPSHANECQGRRQAMQVDSLLYQYSVRRFARSPLQDTPHNFYAPQRSFHRRRLQRSLPAYRKADLGLMERYHSTE